MVVSFTFNSFNCHASAMHAPIAIPDPSLRPTVLSHRVLRAQTTQGIPSSFVVALHCAVRSERSHTYTGRPCGGRSR
jgi:hypothetical protein